jgi:hypothetical protein
MKYTFLKVLLVSALGSLAIGCSAVRVVKVTRDGGEIALLGDREGAMEKARAEMAAQCGGPDSYEIVEQGEVVVGQVTQSREQQNVKRGRRGSFTGFSSGTSTTTDQTEWRVLFECKSGDSDTAELHTLAIPLGA